MTGSEFCILKDLEKLQVCGSLTDTCVVGASSKVFIHRAMLFAAHVEPGPVWHHLDPGEEDGSLVVIVPDATAAELETFVRKLYCPGEEVFYTAVLNTPDNLPGSPEEVFHTAVPQTPLHHHPTQQLGTSEISRNEKKQRLDMISVRLSLLKLQRDEALAKNDKETVKDVLANIDLNNEEILRLEKELEEHNTSEESLEVKEEVFDIDEETVLVKDYHQRPYTDQLLKRQVRIQLKDHLDRVKKHKAAKEREEQEFQYSGSDDDQPPEDDIRAGEPSSILMAPGENILRMNFQAIQDSTKAAQAMTEKNFSPNNKPKIEQQRRSSRKEEIPEPGPPSRPPIPSVAAATPPGPLPQRPLPLNLEEHNTSKESLEVKEEVFDIDEEDDDNDKNIASDFVCTHCGDVFNCEVLLVKHQV